MENKEGNADVLLQAETLLWNQMLSYIDSMSLRCAMELGIPDAIHRHGKPITLPDLLSILSSPPAKALEVRRLMRILTHSGVFREEEEQGHVYYSLTPVSGLLVEKNKGSGGDGDKGLAGFVLAASHPTLINSFHSLGAYLRGEGASPFSVGNGCGIWDMKERDPGFNKVFNDGTASDTKFLMPVLLEKCRHVFDGVRSLVDVGGGTGTAALAIAEAFPGAIKCSVLECPAVVNVAVSLPAASVVEFVVGDMFEHIPPADAIFLKWIIHDWPDEECVKILKRCKEAIISGGGDSGKVIIVEHVLGQEGEDPITTKAKLYFDMLMMALYPGTERGEPEFKKIFADAGFERYRITPALGMRSVIELFP